MFDPEDLEEEVREQFAELTEDPQEIVWGDYIHPIDLTDYAMDQYGPALSDEVDLQEWHKLATTFLPQNQIKDHGKLETCLRVQRVSCGVTGSGKDRFYYKAYIANSWGQFDLAEMEKLPRINVPKPARMPKPVPSETLASPVLDTEVKTRIQITLKRNSKNVRGNTGNFVVYQVKASDLHLMFSSLLDKYPKVRDSAQVVRVQFTEYRLDGGNYLRECGANLNLHNADVSDVQLHIYSVLKAGDWKYTSTVVENKNDVTMTNEVLQEFANLGVGMLNVPAAVSQDYYDKEKYAGKWCLCKMSDAKSLVLAASDEASEVLPLQNNYNCFTYVINPTGTLVSHK